MGTKQSQFLKKILVNETNSHNDSNYSDLKQRNVTKSNRSLLKATLENKTDISQELFSNEIFMDKISIKNLSNKNCSDLSNSQINNSRSKIKNYKSTNSLFFLTKFDWKLNEKNKNSDSDNNLNKENSSKKLNKVEIQKEKEIFINNEHKRRSSVTILEEDISIIKSDREKYNIENNKKNLNKSVLTKSTKVNSIDYYTNIYKNNDSILPQSPSFKKIDNNSLNIQENQDLIKIRKSNLKKNKKKEINNNLNIINNQTVNLEILNSQRKLKPISLNNKTEQEIKTFTKPDSHKIKNEILSEINLNFNISDKKNFDSPKKQEKILIFNHNEFSSIKSDLEKSLSKIRGQRRNKSYHEILESASQDFINPESKLISNFYSIQNSFISQSATKDFVKKTDLNIFTKKNKKKNLLKQNIVPNELDDFNYNINHPPSNKQELFIRNLLNECDSQENIIENFMKKLKHKIINTNKFYENEKINLVRKIIGRNLHKDIDKEIFLMDNKKFKNREKNVGVLNPLDPNEKKKIFFENKNSPLLVGDIISKLDNEFAFKCKDVLESRLIRLDPEELYAKINSENKSKVKKNQLENSMISKKIQDVLLNINKTKLKALK